MPDVLNLFPGVHNVKNGKFMYLYANLDIPVVVVLEITYCDILKYRKEHVV
jgi:hypothetical protein